MQQRTSKVELEMKLGFRLTDIDEEPTESEVQALNKSISKLSGYTIPRPSPTDTKHLIDQIGILRTQERQKDFRNLMGNVGRPKGLLGLLQLIQPQISIFEYPFWIVSAVALILGSYLVPLYIGNGQRPVPLLMFSPLIIACGVAYAFRGFNDELENTVALRWQDLVFARMAIILGYNSLIAFPLLLVAYRALSGPPLMHLILSWLAPLTLWASVALWSSLRFGSVFGAGSAVGLWFLQLAVRNSAPQLYMFTMATTGSELIVRIAVVFAGLTFLWITSTKKNVSEVNRG
ncbi:MAG: hypothetical protein GX335_07775 [Firmicutes bacterium]|nr:hypothetical protein [Bacillota bacterium]